MNNSRDVHLLSIIIVTAESTDVKGKSIFLQIFCIRLREEGMEMKRIAVALIAALTLCSCSLEEDEQLPTEYLDETEASTTQTFVFTGLPDIPSLHADTKTESTDGSSEPEPASAPEEETSEVQPASEAREPSEIPKSSETPPEGVRCIEAPYISQDGSPAGCELVCASMLLAYYDFYITSDELISEGYIDNVPVDTYTDPERGVVMFSGDPNEAFIGDPHTPYGYGCFSGAIRSALRKYLDNEFFDAVDISGISLKDLCMEYIDCGEPLMIWASVDMEPLVNDDANIWEIRETGEMVSWKSNEHCLLLVGYNDENYCFHDPLRGAYTLYPREVAESRYREMGSQAVTIHPW